MAKRKPKPPDTFVRNEIKRLLEKRGMTQRELCLQTGLYESYLSTFLHGNVGMRVETLEDILDALGVKKIE